MRILNAEPRGYSREAHKILSSVGDVIERDCERRQLLTAIQDVDVLVVRLRNFIDSEVFSKAKKLITVVTATTGLNHIDLKCAKAKNVAILSLKGEVEFLRSLTATAELAWSLLLSLCRNIPGAVADVKDGRWCRDEFVGSQLSGKTLGIVGFGRLGSIVAEYGKAFRMNVVASDPYVDKYPSYVTRMELNQLLGLSDVVTMHVNLDSRTHKLLTKKRFMEMKPGALLVNSSRGELIDEDAMLWALDSGLLGGMALDVLAGEASSASRGTKKWLESNPIWKRSSTDPRIVISPHIGGATYESMRDTEIFMANRLVEHLKHSRSIQV